MARTRNAKRSRRRKGGNRFTRWLGFSKKKANNDVDEYKRVKERADSLIFEIPGIKIQIADMEENIKKIMDKLKMD